jgi:transcriptional repressor NrdR
MNCPFCNEPETKVTDSRAVDNRIKRRRVCENCGKRFTTYEYAEASDTRTLMVQKKDGTVELFNRAKIVAGISSAVKKRPVSAEQIRLITESIEYRLAGVRGKTFTTVQIGDMVLAELAKLDTVAYIRFASVYKDFHNSDSFIKIISELPTTIYNVDLEGVD